MTGVHQLSVRTFIFFTSTFCTRIHIVTCTDAPANQSHILFVFRVKAVCCQQAFPSHFYCFLLLFFLLSGPQQSENSVSRHLSRRIMHVKYKEYGQRCCMLVLLLGMVILMTLCMEQFGSTVFSSSSTTTTTWGTRFTTRLWYSWQRIKMVVCHVQLIWWPSVYSVICASCGTSRILHEMVTVMLFITYGIVFILYARYKSLIYIVLLFSGLTFLTFYHTSTTEPYMSLSYHSSPSPASNQPPLPHHPTSGGATPFSPYSFFWSTSSPASTTTTTHTTAANTLNTAAIKKEIMDHSQLNHESNRHQRKVIQDELNNHYEHYPNGSSHNGGGGGGGGGGGPPPLHTMKKKPAYSYYMDFTVAILWDTIEHLSYQPGLSITICVGHMIMLLIMTMEVETLCPLISTHQLKLWPWVILSSLICATTCGPLLSSVPLSTIILSGIFIYMTIKLYNRYSMSIDEWIQRTCAI